VITVLDTPPARRPEGRGGLIPVAIYGNRWCGITQLIRRALDRAGIDYEYVDLDAHPDIEHRLQLLTGGRLRTPLVYVGGEWLMEPDLPQVEAALRRKWALP
jgi:mycoredoxin